MRAAIRCLAVALFLVVLAPPVGARERGDGPSGTTQVERVRIIDNAFRPQNITVARGTVVRWVNRGGGCLLQADPDQPGGVGAVDGRPAVGAVADVRRGSAAPGDVGQVTDEPAVAHAVRGRREPGGDRPHAAVEEVEGAVLAAAAQGVGPDERRRLGLPGQDAGGEHERPVAADQSLGDGLHGGPLGAVGLGRVGPVVLVGEVDDRLGVLGSAARISRPASGSLSTTIVVPGSYFPSRRCSARTSSTMFWITRRSGRAP